MFSDLLYKNIFWMSILFSKFVNRGRYKISNLKGI